MSEIPDWRDELIAELRATNARLEATVAMLTKRVFELEATVVRLERRLGITSRNSSKPPSTDGPGVIREQKTTEPSCGKKRGGQEGHGGHRRMDLAADDVVRYEPTSCGGCGGNLLDADVGAGVGAHWNVVELPPIKPHVTRHEASVRRCHCGFESHGAIPVAVLAHRYGPRFAGLTSLLTTRFSLSRRDVKEISQSVFGVHVSTGTVCALLAEMGRAVETSVQDAHSQVLVAPAVHADETSWRQQSGKRGWLWVAVSRYATVFLTHLSRGGDAAEQLLGQDFSGTLVSDRWGAYNRVVSGPRQLCMAHLLRDAQGMAERGGRGATVGRQLAAVFRCAMHLFQDYAQGRCTRIQLLCRAEPLRRDCRAWLAHGQELSAVRDKQTRAMCKRVLKRETDLWTFLSVPGVEPTNNPAERAIRPAVIARKTSFGSDSENGAVCFARMLSVLATLKPQGRDVLEFLCETLIATRAGTATPSLLVST